MKVEAATDGKSQTLPGFLPKTLEFVAGDGCCCDALECAVAAQLDHVGSRLVGFRQQGFFGRRRLRRLIMSEKTNCNLQRKWV